MTHSTQKISKFLSYILRHAPESIGIELDKNGWANLDDLIKKANVHGYSLNTELILFVVANNDKKRFALSDDGKLIRAVQGHSIKVELQLKPKKPPYELFHGTAKRFINSINQSGLLRGNRHHVHLSSEPSMALKVGSRHGQPIVITIDTKKMDEDGYLFFESENYVWLTNKVPSIYFKSFSTGGL